MSTAESTTTADGIKADFDLIVGARRELKRIQDALQESAYGVEGPTHDGVRIGRCVEAADAAHYAIGNALITFQCYGDVSGAAAAVSRMNDR